MAYTSVIKKLNGGVNGVNTTFTTPTTYIEETFKLVLNGQVYEPDDDKFGWSEVDDSTVELTTAPRSGDVLQGFYGDKASGVSGSPFDPNNIIP